MRVIAGKCRSLPLKTPKGSNTRPTQDRIKETLFNMVNTDIPGAVFVDLFAGSGQIGIEALSRGAKKCYFFDKSSEAADCINSNIRFTHLSESAKVFKGDVFSLLDMINEDHVDIIFIDPPYEEGLENRLFAELSKKRYIDSDTLIILEASLKNEISIPGFEVTKVKEYKTNKHVFIRRAI
ncbi:MAG: 16S rRNA (guanine(966)-N(2))-methyltransferase RsmD [Lachnospiraceae bacterium]|nr:16S rRNA (guanine(966)-N(2))-methyltransferase RsmD [Lachnospiraceae bacterium]